MTADEPVPTSDELAATRRSLHILAEHVLAVDLHAATAKIGLRPNVGGFGQPEHLVEGVRRRVRLVGNELVITSGDHDERFEVSTLGNALTAVGLAAGTTTGVFEPDTSDDVLAPLKVDPAVMASIAAWFRLAEEAIELFRSRHADLNPTVAQLWPEHFDLATSASEINFGASPGDDAYPEPYLYVGPWTQREGEFWTEPFGAIRYRSAISSPADALAFFEEGLAHAQK